MTCLEIGFTVFLVVFIAALIYTTWSIDNDEKRWKHQDREVKQAIEKRTEELKNEPAYTVVFKLHDLKRLKSADFYGLAYEKFFYFYNKKVTVKNRIKEKTAKQLAEEYIAESIKLGYITSAEGVVYPIGSVYNMAVVEVASEKETV